MERKTNSKRGLGTSQIATLALLDFHGSYGLGDHWGDDGDAATRRTLDSLVRRGLATLTDGRYAPAPSAKAEVNAFAARLALQALVQVLGPVRSDPHVATAIRLVEQALGATR